MPLIKFVGLWSLVLSTVLELGLLLLRLYYNLVRYSVTDRFKDLVEGRGWRENADKWYIDVTFGSAALRLLFSGYMSPITAFNFMSGCAQSNITFVPTRTLINLYMVR